MTQKPKFLKTVWELARCYQAFEAYSAPNIREFGLTPAQFDVIATLGNTAGMTPKELSERTLITKGTLTGVLDRLELKRMIRRAPSPRDGRSQIVELTKKGQAMFDKVFPAHIKYLAQAFSKFKPADFARIDAGLVQLRNAFGADNNPVE